jgi:hypothetical protein
MSKARKQGARGPNIPPITTLRTRLDALLGSEAWAGRDVAALEADLDAALAGSKTDEALPILIRSTMQAPEHVRQRLDEVIPGWLAKHGYQGNLLTLLERGAVYPEGRPAANAWLERAGVESGVLRAIRQEKPSFYRAYAYDDGSQGTVHVYWYVDRRRQRVRGMTFLMDHNPPWEGAVKDIASFPTRTPENAIADFVTPSTGRGIHLQEIGATEAKDIILKAMQTNRKEGIRLPRDLIAAREPFLEHVLTLPDGPNTPPFTAQDFAELASAGESPESLSYAEQHFGRRVRMEDGTEVLVLGNPLGEDEGEEE